MAWLQTLKAKTILFPFKFIFVTGLFSELYILSRLPDLIRDSDSLGSCRSQKRKIKSKSFLIIRKWPDWVFCLSLIRHFMPQLFILFYLKKEEICLKCKNWGENQHCVSFLQHASMLLKNINPHKKCGKNICTFWLKRWLEKRKKILPQIVFCRIVHQFHTGETRQKFVLEEESRASVDISLFSFYSFSGSNTQKARWCWRGNFVRHGALRVQTAQKWFAIPSNRNEIGELSNPQNLSPVPIICQSNINDTRRWMLSSK